MIVSIKQNKFNWTDRFSIHTEGNLSYQIKRRRIRFLRFETILIDSIGNKIFSISSKKKKLFRSYEFQIVSNNGEIVNYFTVSAWNSHDRCVANQHTYDVYGHKGRKYSIFKNDSQVAFFEKSPMSFFEGDTYKLVADDDCELPLLICLVIIHDLKSGNNSGNILTFDFGNVANGSKVFDRNWRPKQIVKV